MSLAPQTLYCNASCECNPDQCILLTENHICTYKITELRVSCVRSTGSALITLVRIGYVTRSKNVRTQHSYYNTGVKWLKEEGLTHVIPTTH